MTQVNVNFRPYVMEFLEEAAKFYEIIIYTASEVILLVIAFLERIR